MTRLRRLAMAVGLLALGSLANADSYPAKPVRFIVAFPPGGNADLVARLVGQKLGGVLGRPFVIDNRGGAGGVIGEELVSRSAADGYTILLISLAHVVNPNLGTSLHICGELFKAMTGVNIVNVNYKSGGLAIPDLEAGRVHMAFSVITTAVSLVNAGRMRALAVTSAKRSQVMPELPAIAEFVPGYELTGWQGILAPAGTPRAIVSKLAEEIAKIMRTPDVRNKLVGMGADPVGSTPEEFAAFRKTEFAKLAKLVTRAGIN